MLTLTYCCFAALCGWLEAILYAQRGAEAFSGNEHVGMTLQRVAAALLVPLAMLAYAWRGWWLAGELLPAALLFPMVHDEAYNFTRLWLIEAEKMGALEGCVYGLLPLPRTAKWLIWLLPNTSDSVAFVRTWITYHYGYQSPTTTARNDFNGRARTWLAAAGLSLLLGLHLYLFLQ